MTLKYLIYPILFGQSKFCSEHGWNKPYASQKEADSYLYFIEHIIHRTKQ